MELEHRASDRRSLGMLDVDLVDRSHEPASEAAATSVGGEDVADEGGGLGLIERVARLAPVLDHHLGVGRAAVARARR
jgi:hypothetical protein